MLRLVLGIACALSLILSGVAGAQDYPTRPIRLIVGYGAGGATDLAARIVADHMEKTLRQPITVENRPGGNGTVGTRAVFQAAPDGYTLGMTSGSILTVLPWTMDIGFDPLKLTFIGSTHESFYALFVKGDSPWKTRAGARDVCEGEPEPAHHRELRRLRPAGHRPGPAGQGHRRVAVPHRPDLGRRRAGPEAPVRRRPGPGELGRGHPVAPEVGRDPRAPRLQHVLARAREDGGPAQLEGLRFQRPQPFRGGRPAELPEPIRKKLEDALAKAMGDPDTLAKLEKIGELVEYKTGQQIKDAATRVQAEQLEVGKLLDKVKK